MILSALLHFPLTTKLGLSLTHFLHTNIGRYCDRQDDWQEMIIDNWNRFIHPEEVIFHVGDLALGKKDKLEGLAALLNVRLHLCRVFRRIG
jgi:calcineurin-like phosphoesterase family protein